MNTTSSFRNAFSFLIAIGLALTGAATANAAAPALQGQIAIRPLTPTEIQTYGLNGIQGASGLATIGVGEPAYLEALVNAAIAPSNILSVTWTLTNRPAGSAAALTVSPLGANVPTYKMADRINQAGVPVYEVAGRILLRPDAAGQYTVTAAIVTSGSGSTNLTQTITAGTYLGANTCALCHSGGVAAENTYVPWSQSPHASFFTRAIDGLESSHYSKNCISCHTVGYDANTNAVNGGFDDIAAQLGWTFPTILTNGNWASMPPALQNLSNIQCENCHGPGSEHAFSLGNTNLISKTFGAGDCAQCHDDTPTHFRGAEWNNSVHAVTTRTPSGAGREACVRCHTGPGFAAYLDHASSTNTYATNTVYEAITCQACHDPHDASNPHQLRAGTTCTLSDGTTVTNAGSGALCMNCHHIRNGPSYSNITNYQQGLPTWAGGSSFGTHDGPQGEMLEGVGAITYGKVLPSAAHRTAITNTCAGCHMQPVASTDPAFLQAGGHTFNMTYEVVTAGVTNTFDKVDVCIQCHGQIDSFDMVRQDYNGDGVIEGVQTEVQHLLDQLSTLLPNSAYVADGNYFADGLVKTSVSTRTNWPVRFLNAAYNWSFVNNDGSKGVHNAPYAVGLLKAAIADLTGDANNDGIPDWWQVQYFGSATSPSAAPNATPAGDGVPNWLKYSLGLNPLVPGVANALTGGIVYADGTSLGGSSPTNTIQIYTAAEVTFDTEVGKTYQLQVVTSLSGGWQNLGAPIVGTGTAMSYVTPTRRNVQQFFRVSHTP